ncbi:hypothetical protein AC739_08345 [Planococcus glaciei]|uniref:Na-translocating system protein MpsC family protein n=1 Tax=Planococcus glaciei TaxID=459472 RepID=UPI00069F2656|nr:Na-translocating system protein MpsC family protein [Planococcus glaciei]KOF10660.1 hypothetical protein AC739_08345 [Planococcus glaciei]
MAKEKTLESEIGSYFSNLLRTNFGKGPTSVYVTIAEPFITVHFRGFISPMERVLINQKEHQRILETRDLMMDELKPDIMLELSKHLNNDVQELYADWNLEKETGMIISVLNGDDSEGFMPVPEDIDLEAFRGKIIEASNKAQKAPGSTTIYWLSDRTIVVRRTEILVEIEKALIKNGFEEQLKLAKRPLEHQMLLEVGIESVLNRSIAETFLDWNFEKDLGFTIFLLEPPKANET